jgi:hypothetical protein
MAFACYETPLGGLIVAPELLAITCRLVADHFTECPACCLAGGEQADPEDLCVTGQQLLRNREDAEKSLVFKELQAYRA